MGREHFKQIGPTSNGGNHDLLYDSERRILAYAREIKKSRERDVYETTKQKAARDEVLQKRKEILKRVQYNQKLALGERIATLLKDGKQSLLWIVIRDSTSTRVREQMMLIDTVTDEVKSCMLWRSHYAALAADQDSHSKDASYWVNVPINPPSHERSDMIRDIVTLMREVRGGENRLLT